ncbi:phage major tail tube protein [Marinobacterium jannaschii]|uniref:phage major tail tube protein n=1 Tax=Marinobacterium jannaschii TaxID=64970 RepID=UPI0004877A70|nr:phage major tail tube protein [Marinobacterium jannaschii]
MADTRVTRLTRAIINGNPVMGELEGYTPPPVEKEMEDAKGGRFFAEKIMTGLKVGDASFKLSGVPVEVLQAMGVTRGESCEITVLGVTIDEDGVELPQRWEHSGEIISIKQDEVKPGKESRTLEYSCKAYKHMDGGKVIYDLNTRTQKCVVGGKDLLENARKLVEMA